MLGSLIPKRSTYSKLQIPLVKMHLSGYVLAVMFVFSIINNVHSKSEKELVKTLIEDYKRRGIYGRPVRNNSDKVLLKYGLSLVQILDLDEQNQVLSTNVWTTYWWKDYHVHWNPEEYGNVSKVRIPSNTLWKPDVKLYNFADVRDDEKRDANLVVESDGSILWIPQAIFKSTCSIDTRLFPFDVQKCDIKLGTWTYDGSKIDLDFIYEGESGFEMTDYVQSNEWDIVRTWAKKHVVVYKCCPEPYIDLTFSLSIRRKPAFYGYILILPCMLLSSLTLVLFWIPFGSPAKMILGMNIFVAFFVLLLLLSESTPKAASTIPLIGVYYCLNMILITVSTFLCVLVVNLSYHGYVTRVPSIVRKIMLGFLAHVLCVTKAKRKIRKPDNLLRKIECRQENGDIAHQKQDASSPLLSEHYTQEEVKGSVRIATLLEREVKEIKDYLQRLEEKRIQKEENDCITQEWIQVALVLDRIFFVLYVILIIVSVVAVFGNAVINSPPVKNN